MSKLSKLLQVTNEDKSEILQHFNITEEEFAQNVKIIQEWLNQHPYLPKENDENKVRMALLNSKMSLEKTKQCIEGYYRVRRLHAEFFDKLMPNTEAYKKSKSYVQTVVMPKLGPDLCRITIYKHFDVYGEADDALIYNIIVLMIGEIRFFNDCCLSNIIIIDMENYGLKNFIKYTPSINQKLTDIMNSVNLRIKEVHVVNAPSFMERILILLKTLLPAKIVSKIRIHSSYKTLTDYIPKEQLPGNYGGTGKSIEELFEGWCNELENMEPIFKNLLNVKSSEDIKKSQDYEIFGMGSEGSFKKLSVD